MKCAENTTTIKMGSTTPCVPCPKNSRTVGDFRYCECKFYFFGRKYEVDMITFEIQFFFMKTQKVPTSTRQN